jgi:hypothetical protein
MEIEEMKTLWEEMSSEIEKKNKLTDTMIIKMIHTDYRNKLQNILIPEVIGAFVCLAGALFIIVNLQKLNVWYLLICGIVSVLILFLLPILSLKAIRKIRSLNIPDNNFKQSLLEYSKSKLQFVFVQKLSFYLGALLMLSIIPVMGKLISGTDFFKATSLWYWYAIGFPFFYFFANWVFKSYRKTVSQAESILKELDV